MSELKARKLFEAIPTSKEGFYQPGAFVDGYLKSEADKVIAEKDAEIARLQTVSGSERLWLVNYQAILSNGSIRLGHCALHSNRTGETLLKEAYEACESKHPPKTEIVLCSVSDLGVSVESANTYSGVVTREG